MIKTFANQELMIAQIKEDIKINHNQKPIIIILDENQDEFVKQILSDLKINEFREGVNEEVLNEIRSWTFGILLLRSEDSFGTNTRFA